MKLKPSMFCCGIICSFLLNSCVAFAFPTESNNTKETVGYSHMIGGGVLAWLGVFAGYAGKGPCEDEKDEAKRSDCFDQEKEKSKKYDNLRIGLIGIGLSSVGAGYWLVRTSQTLDDGVGLYFNSSSANLVARISF